MTHPKHDLQLLLLVTAAREMVEADDDFLKTDVAVDVGVKGTEQVLGILSHVAAYNVNDSVENLLYARIQNEGGQVKTLVQRTYFVA